LLSLQTERLTLRPFREEDVPDCAAMCADPEVMRFLGGKSYATEAAQRALDYAFTELDREHVISLIHPKNTASRAVAERLGEQYEETIEFFGERISVYGLWRRDWNGE
jgi:RimJ/RimL family protein N-acetyltransferase